MKPPVLSIFLTDTDHNNILRYIICLQDLNLFRKFINNKININLSMLIPNHNNQRLFNKKWEENYKNFTEASMMAKYRRDIDYNDLLVLTLFYVLYDIDLYEELFEEIENGILIMNDVVSLENNNMGLIYLSIYKQLKHCSKMIDNKLVVMDEMIKEYFI